MIRDYLYNKALICTLHQVSTSLKPVDSDTGKDIMQEKDTLGFVFHSSLLSTNRTKPKPIQAMHCHSVKQRRSRHGILSKVKHPFPSKT